MSRTLFSPPVCQCSGRGFNPKHRLKLLGLDFGVQTIEWRKLLNGNFRFSYHPPEAQHHLKLLGLRCWSFWLLRNPSQLSNAKLEQDLAAAIRFQGLLERFLKLVERVYTLHCGGERSIGYQVS